jgi:hypothetical protein
MSQNELYEWIANLDCSRWPDEPEELTQIERLAHPKGAILTGEDRLQQLLACAFEQLMIHCPVKQ